MIIKKIAILGGTGFVGRTLANQLADDGYEIVIPTRDREANKQDLILLPKLQLVEVDVHDPAALRGCLEGCDAVINLVGILNETGTSGAGFHRAHVELSRKILDTCHALGIQRLLHMSALNADPQGPSHYLRTKGEAENLVHTDEEIHVTSFRPSVIFGPADSFFNRFATLMKITPLVFPLACADAKFAPVYVGDLCEAMLKTLHDPDYYGKRLELCGPKTYTLLELVRYTAHCSDIRRMVYPLPDFLGRIQASLFDLTGFVFNLINMQKPFSSDNFASLQKDSITDNNALKQLGIIPTAIESIVPQYLSPAAMHSPYDRFRQRSRRNQ